MLVVSRLDLRRITLWSVIQIERYTKKNLVTETTYDFRTSLDVISWIGLDVTN